MGIDYTTAPNVTAPNIQGYPNGTRHLENIHILYTNIFRAESRYAIQCLGFRGLRVQGSGFRVLGV